MAELLLKEEVFAIIGAAMEVHTELSPGFLEAVYQEALGIEFEMRGIPHSPFKKLDIHYKGRRLQKEYIADYVAYTQVVIELKAQDGLTGVDEAQLLNYLKATRHRVGVLINFGKVGRLEWRRLVR